MVKAAAEDAPATGGRGGRLCSVDAVDDRLLRDCKVGRGWRDTALVTDVTRADAVSAGGGAAAALSTGPDVLVRVCSSLGTEITVKPTPPWGVPRLPGGAAAAVTAAADVTPTDAAALALAGHTVWVTVDARAVMVTVGAGPVPNTVVVRKESTGLSRLVSYGGFPCWG